MRFALTTLFAVLLSVCNAQNVGIGITTPAVPLHIRNNGSELLRIQGNDPYLSFFNNSGVGKGFVQGHGDNLNIGTWTGNPTGILQFYNNNNINMAIHPNSHVGIGTGTDIPAFKLTVQTNNDNYGIIHRSNNIIVGTWIGSNSGAIGGWYGTYTNHPLMFFTNNGGPQITLLQNGNLGIGNNFPQSRLDVNGTILTTGSVGIGTTNPLGRVHINSGGNALTLSGNSPYIYYLDAANTPKGFLWNKGGNNMDLGTEVGNNLGEVKLTIRGYEALTVQNDGRIRVGPNPSVHSITSFGLPHFTVNGILTIKMLSNPFNEWSIFPILGALNFNIGDNPKAYVDDVGDWNAVSDIRLKENVKQYKNVLSNIQKLEVSTYQFKVDTTGKLSFGLIAQNVLKYFPEIVSETQVKDGQKILGISYAKTGVLAIKAIQEQQQIIESQQKTIEEQQKKIESQQKKTNELEKRLTTLENKLK